MGLVINDSMSWKNHLYGDENESGLLRTLSQQLGILKKLRKYTEPKRYLTLMSGIFMSRLMYGISAWGYVSGIPGQQAEFRAGITKRDIQRLQSLQNKALKLTFYRDPMYPTKLLMKETNQLSINQLIALHIIMSTYKINLSKKPEYHYERLFGTMNGDARTRSNQLRRVEFRLNLGRSSYFYQASRLWAVIPEEIKQSPSLGTFKVKIKSWIKENIPLKT